MVVVVGEGGEGGEIWERKGPERHWSGPERNGNL